MIAYKYHCEPCTPEDTAKLVAQLRRAGSYRRELVRIENLGRVLRRAVSSLEPKDARDPYYKQIRDAQAAAVRAARALVVESTAEGEPPLYWGTYLQVEAAVDQAQRTTTLGHDVSDAMLAGGGLLAVQIQKTKPVDAGSLLGGEDTRVRMSQHLVRRGSELMRNGQPRPSKHHELQIRIGSDPSSNRVPIWAHLFVRLHRPLPMARLAWVLLRARRIGPRIKWSVVFLVDQDHVRAVPGRSDAACGVDIHWRTVETGIRIATWIGTDGAQGELVIPPEVTQRAPKSESLRAIRDRAKNELVAQLCAWKADRDLPPPLAECLSHAHAWRKTGRIVGLERIWRANRHDGDEAMYDAIVAFLKHDRHLWAWEAHNREKMGRQIAGRIEQLAVSLAKRYAVVGVEERGMVPELITTETATDDDDAWRRRLNARRVSVLGPALLRSMLERFCTKYKATYVEVEPATTTIDCSVCGTTRADPSDGRDKEITCGTCGLTEDRAVTAAKNICVRASDAAARAAISSSTEPATYATKKKLGARRTRKKVATSAAVSTTADSPT